MRSSGCGGTTTRSGGRRAVSARHTARATLSGDGACQVHLEYAPQLVQRHELEWPRRGNPGVVDEATERRTRERMLYFRPRSGDAPGIGDVHLHRCHAGLLERGGVLRAPHRPEYTEAAAGEVARDARADAGRGSRHDDARGGDHAPESTTS